jgi:hypothetical protein
MRTITHTIAAPGRARVRKPAGCLSLSLSLLEINSGRIDAKAVADCVAQTASRSASQAGPDVIVACAPHAVRRTPRARPAQWSRPRWRPRHSVTVIGRRAARGDVHMRPWVLS